MKAYKIMTEAKNEQYIIDRVAVDFEGFTVYHAKGYWKGFYKDSLVIEIVSTDNRAMWYIDVISNDIKRHNKQEAVLIQSYDAKMDLV